MSLGLVEVFSLLLGGGSVGALITGVVAWRRVGVRQEQIRMGHDESESERLWTRVESLEKKCDARDDKISKLHRDSVELKAKSEECETRFEECERRSGALEIELANVRTMTQNTRAMVRKQTPAKPMKAQSDGDESAG